MANILGWKDILRPIRDGYRHLFPSPDTGPTPEERRKRREADRTKGFTYFDTFDQLESWTKSGSDALQKANTPLLRRSGQSADDEAHTAKVLLCHDYAGNYHDYEDIQGMGLDEDMYACEYLQYIDTFVYFSHKLACVPPPTWINTLHRNGVKALGTILIEPQTTETERLLQHTGDGDDMIFDLAKQLAKIAKYLHFDGWLINIEKPFPTGKWRRDVLAAFLVQLRGEMGSDMQLIWYDALTTSNEVHYQNGLNASNLRFAEACGSILTNYCWTESQARDSKSVAVQSGLPSENLFFGIDVWAQNSTKLTQPRTTFPKRGGGGTNTGIAVAKLADIGLSAGIFAPAWSFEHFPGRGRDVERAMWEGEALPDGVTCSCGNAALRHQPNSGFAITQVARVFPAGSDNFFYTDFTRAINKHSDADKERCHGDHLLHAQLGAQSILPLPAPSQDRDRHTRLSHRLEESNGHTKLVIEAHNRPTTKNRTNQYFEHWLPLYKLNMPANDSLRLKISCQNLLPNVGAMPSLYLKFSGEADYMAASDRTLQLLPVSRTEGISTIERIIGTPLRSDKDIRLEELGVHLSGSTSPRTVLILEILSISITPEHTHKAPNTHSITSIRIQYRGEGENLHRRLCWNMEEMNGGAEARINGMPHSEITGPFSHFDLSADGWDLGRAYALEYVLSQDLIDKLAGKAVEFTIAGIGFDGRSLTSNSDIFFIDP